MIALRSVDLPGQLHWDPADRIMVATARQLAAPLVTKDHKIRSYPHVATIWQAAPPRIKFVDRVV